MNYLCLSLLVLLTGCTLQTVEHHINQAWLDEAVSLEPTELSVGALAQSVDKPWLLGAAVSIKKQAAAPAVLHSKQTFSFSLEAPLPGLDELVRRLSFLSDLTVSISPEARLPLAHFLPRLGVESEVEEPTQHDPLVFERLRLPDLLDQIAAVYSVRWRYRAGRIELYRTETRRFALPLTKAVNTVQLSQPAGDALESSVGTAPIETPNWGDSALVHLQETAQAFLSRAGTVKVLGVPPNALLVTDTPERLGDLGLALRQQPDLWYWESARVSRSMASGGGAK